MSVYALKPNFTDKNGYKDWRKTWTTVYIHISNEIRRRKNELKILQKDNQSTGKLQKDLLLLRADARKMMTLLDEAKLRRDRILNMHKQIAEQDATFPLSVEARTVDVHFNKISNEFSFMPMWVVKAQGKSYYVRHIDAQMGFSTRETEGNSTRGMLRFRNVTLTIDKESVASLSLQKNKLKMVA